jgi:hypothetical protein
MQLSRNRQRDPAQLGIKIQVDAVAMQKFWQWVDLAKGEVSALGLVDEIRDANTGMITALLVTDFFLVKQQCSPDETTMDAAAIAELMLDLEAKDIDSRKLRCWAHSHAQMQVFWSGTDNECIAGLANGEYLISLVVNKNRDAMCRLDSYHPCHMYLTDVVWEIVYPHVDGLAETCLAEFKSKVTECGPMHFQRGTAREHLFDLQEAHERGALTIDELHEEMELIGMDEEFNERPF